MTNFRKFRNFTRTEATGISPGASVVTLAVLVLSAGVLFEDNVAHADIRTSHSSLVSENASFFTPGAVDGRVEAIAIEGDTVYVGGTFTQVQMALDGEVVDQPYLYAYSKSTGAIITDFDPILNNAVYALQTTGEGTGIFVGGAFTTINGQTNRKGLAKLDDFGDRVSGFSARPDKRVYTMDRSGDTLYIGGNFTRIGQTPAEFLAAIDTTTGALLPDINLDFDGVVSSNVTTGSPSVDDIEVTSDDQLMVVVGNFTSINGISRTRLALLELDSPAMVSTWNTDVFDIDCPAGRLPQYIKGLDIAPDDSYFLTGSTGWYRLGSGEAACDAINRFDLNDLTNTNAQPTWSSYTGGDAVYDIAASEHAIYVGGHFRWLNNELGNDFAGPGAIPRRGFGALDPLNGLPLLDWRSDRNPRGVGIFSLEIEPEGLYMGDDTDFLNGIEHPKFKFLPITSNTIERPQTPTLPSTIFQSNGSALDAIAFDGTTLDAPMPIASQGWDNTRGAMLLDGQLFHADDNGNMWVSPLLADNTFGSRTQVDLHGLTQSQWDLSELTGMFFDHEQGRVYYTLENDYRLFWRAFTPDGPLFGVTEHVAEHPLGSSHWENVRGMDVIDGQLYFGYVDGSLYRVAMDGAVPVAGTDALVSGPLPDGRDWNNPFLAFSSGGSVTPPQMDAEFEFESVGSSSVRSFRSFEFPVQAGEPVNVRLTWDDANAELNVFLRDANGQLVDSSNDRADNATKWLYAPAGNGGTYKVSVKIKQGSTAYKVSVNPTQAAPEPLADFQFSTSGSETENQWQVFKFDVEAGDLVEAQVLWNDPNANIKVFLRDESGTMIDRSIDFNGTPEMVSAVAATSGQWSVAVRIVNGSIDYDVLVDTTR